MQAAERSGAGPTAQAASRSVDEVATRAAHNLRLVAVHGAAYGLTVGLFFTMVVVFDELDSWTLMWESFGLRVVPGGGVGAVLGAGAALGIGKLFNRALPKHVRRMVDPVRRSRMLQSKTVLGTSAQVRSTVVSVLIFLLGATVWTLLAVLFSWAVSTVSGQPMPAAMTASIIIWPTGVLAAMLALLRILRLRRSGIRAAAAELEHSFRAPNGGI